MSRGKVYISSKLSSRRHGARSLPVSPEQIPGPSMQTNQAMSWAISRLSNQTVIHGGHLQKCSSLPCLMQQQNIIGAKFPFGFIGIAPMKDIALIPFLTSWKVTPAARICPVGGGYARFYSATTIGVWRWPSPQQNRPPTQDGRK